MQDFNIHNLRIVRSGLAWVVGALLIASGTVVATTSDIHCTFMPMLSCVDAQGNTLWNNINFNDGTASAEDQNRLLISQSGHAYAFSRQDGQQLWDVNTESDALYFFPVIDADSVYLARTDGVLEKRQSDSGFVIWRSQPGQGWVYPPVQFGKQLFTGGQDGMIWQIDPQTGRPIGQYKLDQELVMPLLITNGLLVAATFDGKLNAYRVSEDHSALLQTVWQADIGTAVFNMFVIDNNLIVSDMGGQLSSVNSRDGNINWQAVVHRNARYWSTVAQQKLYSLTNTGTLNILDLQSGKHLDQLQFPGEFSRAPIVHDDAIVLFDINGVNKGGALSTSPLHRRPLSMASTPETPNTLYFNQREE